MLTHLFLGKSCRDSWLSVSTLLYSAASLNSNMKSCMFSPSAAVNILYVFGTTRILTVSMFHFCFEELMTPPRQTSTHTREWQVIEGKLVMHSYGEEILLAKETDRYQMSAITSSMSHQAEARRHSFTLP